MYGGTKWGFNIGVKFRVTWLIVVPVVRRKQLIKNNIDSSIADRSAATFESISMHLHFFWASARKESRMHPPARPANRRSVMAIKTATMTSENGR
jgi:hypothetical protein